MEMLHVSVDLPRFAERALLIDPPLVVSAFAARKNLWGAPVESPTVREDNQEAEGTSAKRVSGRSRPSPAADKEVPSIEKGAETKSTPTASDQNSNGGKSPAQLSGGVPGTHVLPIAAQTGTAGNDVPRRAVVQHSSFRPNKKNYQDKARGRTILKLAEGEVSLRYPPPNTTKTHL